MHHVKSHHWATELSQAIFLGRDTIVRVFSIYCSVFVSVAGD